MKRVFIAENPFEAKLAKDLLEAAGIESIVRGDYLFSLRGGLPLTADTLPSVWVVHDEDVGRAEGLLEQQQQRSMFRCIDGDVRR